MDTILFYLIYTNGGLEVASWPLVPKFVGSNPAEAVRFLRVKKNPQHAFLRRRSKAVCPMSQVCGMGQISRITWKSNSRRNLS
jgi:hypothetical protein